MMDMHTTQHSALCQFGPADMFNLAPASSAIQDRLYLKRKTRFSVHSPYSLELELRQICFYVRHVLT